MGWTVPTPEPRVVLHSTEGTTIAGAEGAYEADQSWPHVTADPWRRIVHQHYPLDRAARALLNAVGGVSPNRDHAIQIEIIGYSDRALAEHRNHQKFVLADMTDDDLKWLAEVVLRPILAATGVPAVTFVQWPPYPASYGDNGVRLTADEWIESAAQVLGHMHVSENLHGDPTLDIHRLLAFAAEPETEPEEMTKPVVMIQSPFPGEAVFLRWGSGLVSHAGGNETAYWADKHSVELITENDRGGYHQLVRDSGTVWRPADWAQ